jgi:hypothetical protein
VRCARSHGSLVMLALVPSRAWMAVAGMTGRRLSCVHSCGGDGTPSKIGVCPLIVASQRIAVYYAVYYTPVCMSSDHTTLSSCCAKLRSQCSKSAYQGSSCT